MSRQDGSKRLYSIGEVSKLCNLSKKALRYYDQIGILSPDVVLKENGYRYYSEETLYQIPILKYYKQMGFKLEEMQGLVEGKGYYYLEQDFRSKIDELRAREREIHNSCIAVNDWYHMLEEARMVRQNNIQTISVKFMLGGRYCWKDQKFEYNYPKSILNIEWVNYLESINNEITGPVILKFSSYKDKMNGMIEHSRIMQRPIRPCCPGANVSDIESMMVISSYHIGPMEKLHETYRRIDEWILKNGYCCTGECYERYVVDYWATRNTEEFVTEIIIPVLDSSR